ncbi:hypothetical protein KFK09_017904 [Dendrobium nobile]|nr:hypothetical protein KFK09_017904 [Dendrobium nobile]
MEGARHLLLVRTEQSRREGGGSASCLAKTESERLKELGPAVILEKKKDPFCVSPSSKTYESCLSPEPIPEIFFYKTLKTFFFVSFHFVIKEMAKDHLASHQTVR